MAEVLSPATADVDRGRKREAYGLVGVAHYWLVDPDTRTVEAFTNLRGKLLPEVSLGPGDVLAAPPFGDLGVAVSALTPDGRPLTRSAFLPLRTLPRNCSFPPLRGLGLPGTPSPLTRRVLP